MKYKWLLVLLILFIIPINIRAEDINSGEISAGNNCSKGNCWQSIGSINGNKDKALRAIRITIFNEKAERVSNSLDFSLNSGVSGYNVQKTTQKISKIEYLNGALLEWKDSNLSDLISVPNHITEYVYKNSDLSNGNKSAYEVFARYIYDHQGIINTFSSNIDDIEEKLKYCRDEYSSKCQDDYKYYIVFEPATSVIYNGTKYYGTSYELIKKVGNSSKTLTSVVRRTLPNALYITGEYESFYQAAKIGSKNGNYDIHKENKNANYSVDEVTYYGLGISVYGWDYDKQNDNNPENKTCNVNVNINECGESSIYEANNNEKECIVDNETYSYIKECNLYCSDEITTNFSGLYNTFVGNNSLGAIVSGKYISIKSNPMIAIKKTCYQSSKSNECPNVTSALSTKLKSDYRTNKIYLNLDGRKYDLIGNVDINQDGLNAVITYEYKLDSNINKYIDIETMKGVLQESNITYANENSMIMTNKTSYGTYTYNLDVSETALNKYASNSSAIKKLVNTQSSKYNYKNTISINYNKTDGSKKDSYVSNDLNGATCSYKKYNSDTGCICTENKCCDSLTCKEIECPPDSEGKVCECTGKYGCYDDGKCTSIKGPDTNDNSNDNNVIDACNPEEKTCFPNVIYRPISLIEPFPGIEGNGRTPGSNWNKIYITNDGKGISYSEYYIKIRRGYKDYEIYQAEPLYVIKLDGEKIQEIRKYNDKHENDYNDFELSCVNGENCISSFLRGQAKDFSINLIESGTCKNINNYNFDSCIKDKGK